MCSLQTAYDGFVWNGQKKEDKIHWITLGNNNRRSLLQLMLFNNTFRNSVVKTEDLHAIVCQFEC